MVPKTKVNSLGPYFKGGKMLSCIFFLLAYCSSQFWFLQFPIPSVIYQGFLCIPYLDADLSCLKSPTQRPLTWSYQGQSPGVCWHWPTGQGRISGIDSWSWKSATQLLNWGYLWARSGSFVWTNTCSWDHKIILSIFAVADQAGPWQLAWKAGTVGAVHGAEPTAWSAPHLGLGSQPCCKPPCFHLV